MSITVYKTSATEFRLNMSDFSNARTNMVDCQIHTSGVISPVILQAFETVPRERFVPEGLQNVAYNDEDLPLGEGRFLLEPATHARMLQAIEPQPDDVVLDVGGATGYSAAILSFMASTVMAVEEKKKHITWMEEACNALDICNVVGFKGALKAGCAQHAPYNLIFMSGSVSEIPQELVKQLAPGGRLVTIIREPGKVMGQVTLIQSLGEKGVSSYTLFEAATPYLPGFEPQPAFTF
jgi:protein-L-isoaspartate(D-aspartate) O-methyltransferase